MSADPLAALRGDPRHAAVLSDFDGTLAAIVERPDQARPLDGVVELLDALAHRYRLVGVISGRPVEFLGRFFPPTVVLAGLYGLEIVRDGSRRDDPAAGPWRAVIDDVASVSRTGGPAGMLVESKGLSLTLHYRTRPELADAVRGWAAEQAARSGLEARPARMSVELHPPIAADKGTAVAELVAGARHVCYVGDDLGDLPAFDALDQLGRDERTAVRIAVASDESPAELLERADVVVDGPTGARTLLQSLLDPLSRQ